MTIQELYTQLQGQVNFIIEYKIRNNKPVLRIGFYHENTKINGLDCYQDGILRFIPEGFEWAIQPNSERPGEEIIIYKSKNKT